jgi:hypothetical protein
MRQLIKFWGINRQEKKLFCEALGLLLLSQLCVKLIAFRHIYRFLGSPWKPERQCNLDLTDEIRIVTLSVSRAAGGLPWKSLCLSRSIAAFLMFRRRGIPAVVLAGVKFEGSSLLAHAWIHAGHGIPSSEVEAAPFSVVMRIGQAVADVA